MAGQDLFSLKWNNYQENMSAGFRSLFDQDQLTDVTIHSGDSTWRAHRVVLCASSPYFEKLLAGRLTVWQHPVLILNHIQPASIQSILEYIYSGKVTLENNKLEDFMRVGDILNVKGLSTTQNKQNKARPEVPSGRPMVRIVKQKRRSTEKNSDNPRVKERKIFEDRRNTSPQYTTQQNIIQEDEEGEGDHLDLIKEEPLDTEPSHTLEDSELVIVKADPDDFHQQPGEVQSDRQMPPLTIRNDLLPPSDRFSVPNDRLSVSNDRLSAPTSMFGETGRCHFCSEECGSKYELTEHLKTVHMPVKHALCENCENFFHVCAIMRHKLKCQARYQSDT